MEAIAPRNTMDSRQIAELTGKNHAHLMRDIRNMEDAWVKVNGSKFGLVDYVDAKGEKRPMYLLTKSECLYVATKFNDEARAKLILRWEELERGFSAQNISRLDMAKMLVEAEEARLMLMQKTEQQQKVIQEQAPKVEYHDKVLQATGLMATTQIAADLGVSAVKLNEFLFRHLGWQFKVNGTWVPSIKIKHLNYMQSRTYTYTNERGEEKVSQHFYWTQIGRAHLMNEAKKYRDKGLVNPLI